MIKGNGPVQEESLEDSVKGFNEAFADFKAATVALEAAKKEFFRTSLIYESYLRSKLMFEASNSPTPTIQPANTTATLMRPVLSDATLRVDDAAPFSKGDPHA